MKKLSFLFVFLGLFAVTNLSAQTTPCCILPDGTCILASGKTCNVASCTPAQKASCQKTVASCATQAKTTTVAKAVAIKKTEKKTCCAAPAAAACSKGKAKAVKTSQIALKEE